MPIRQGWEVSPDRVDKYEKMTSTDPLGDVIMTSKCRLNKDHGFLIAGDNGFGWRLKLSFRDSSLLRIAMNSGKNKWVRWHDVNDITPKKPGQVLVHILKRKNGSLVVDKRGNIKIKRWKLTIKPHKGEAGYVFKQRKDTFIQIISDIWSNNRPSEPPAHSDSRM